MNSGNVNQIAIFHFQLLRGIMDVNSSALIHKTVRIYCVALTFAKVLHQFPHWRGLLESEDGGTIVGCYIDVNIVVIFQLGSFFDCRLDGLGCFRSRRLMLAIEVCSYGS